MKRPAPITAALVSLCIAFGITLLSFLNPPPDARRLTVVVVNVLLSVLHLGTFVGLLRCKRWAVRTAATIFSVWALGILLVGVMSARQQASLAQGLYIAGFAGLIVWLVVALLRSPDVRAYVAPAQAHAPVLTDGAA